MHLAAFASTWHELARLSLDAGRLLAASSRVGVVSFHRCHEIEPNFALPVVVDVPIVSGKRQAAVKKVKRW